MVEGDSCNNKTVSAVIQGVADRWHSFHPHNSYPAANQANFFKTAQHAKAVAATERLQKEDTESGPRPQIRLEACNHYAPRQTQSLASS